MEKNIIEFEYGFDELDEWEMPLRGYRNDVLVTCPNGKKYKLCFYDPIRLSQDIEDEEVILEKNLIVIKKVTLENIHDAIDKITTSNFFNELKEMD